MRLLPLAWLLLTRMLFRNTLAHGAQGREWIERALVFGTLTIPQMCKAGFWLNVAGIVLVTLLGYAFFPFVLGIAVR